MKRRLPPPMEQDWYAIHECYFRDGVLEAITEDAATIEGDTREEVNEVRAMMFQAIRSAVIDYDAFVASLSNAPAQTTEDT